MDCRKNAWMKSMKEAFAFVLHFDSRQLNCFIDDLDAYFQKRLRPRGRKLKWNRYDLFQKVVSCTASTRPKLLLKC